MMKEDSLSSEWSNVEKSAKTDMPDDLEQNKSSMDVEEEDESHLPPGVRKQNRINNSSSSSSEDEVEKPKEPLSSDSDSEKSDHKPSVQEASGNSSSSRRGSKSERKRSSTSKDKEVPGKSRRSKSRSGSRSRSRSGSPRKRRKSSDRSRHSRSRSRDRRHKKDRRRRSHRSRSKDRRRSRDRHRHKRDHRRSRSRSRDRRDRHKDRKGSRRSRSRGRRSRSRSRSGERRRDSRSGSPVGRVIKFGDKVIKPGASFGRPSSNFAKPLTFKEKMRQQLIKAMEDGTNATEALTNKDGVVMCTQTAGIHQHQHHQATQQQQQSQLGMAVPKKPPVPLMANLVTSTASLVSMTVTASEAAMQSMLAMQKEATEKTGVEIPKYYNPAAINPMKYAEQVQKRKLLWSKSKEKDVKSQWHATTLSGDHDDKSKEKFRKLMGIKEDESPGEEGGEEKQKQLFDQLDKEYQYARMATHTHRGIGLGFGSQAFQPPPTQQQPPAAQPQQPDPNT